MSVTQDEAVLSAEDLAFFEDNGYLLLKQAVPRENVQAVVETMFAFMEMDPNDRAAWYRTPNHTGGMIELYQHQTLWDNRQSPRIYGAFAQLWQERKLWVSIDRVSFKPPHDPANPEASDKGFLHLDADIKERPISFGLQGVLALAETTAEQGGFHCLPGWHKPEKQDEFARLLGDRERPSFYGDEIPWEAGVTPVPMEAGDMVIWHRALPHGNGVNRAEAPRMAQYINMRPAREDDEKARQARIATWRDRTPPPDQPWVQGDPRQWEQKHGQTAELTELGRKLLGLELWG